MDTVLLLARLFLAGVFALSGITKLADLDGSRRAVAGFGVPERMARPVGIALPIAELVLAVLLLPVSTAWWGALGALVLLLGFIAGIGYNLRKGRTPDCHCFGKVHSEPIGPATLVRDGAFALVAAIIVLFGWDDAGASLTGWFGDLSGAEQVLTIAMALLAAAVAGMAWLLLQVVRQNGRLLLRIDAIDNRLASGAPMTELPPATDATPQPGLPVGTPAPGFRLDGIYGESQTLDALLAAGKPVMLVFSSPTCGPCTALMPDIGQWQRMHAEKVTVAVIGQGDAAANRAKSVEHGLTNVLLQNNGEVSGSYHAKGTPTAVLIAADGSIASPVAAGAESIRTLFQSSVVKSAPAAPIPVRVAQTNGNGQGSNGSAHNGTAEQPSSLGKPAPDISLSDLDGNSVTLADFAGEPTAVIFWNPGCGFCRKMLDDLKTWETERPAGSPRALVVSTGTVDANKEQGIASTVILDEGFATGRAFGVSGTPSAVLVDENGRIASAPAVGGPRVMAMLTGEEIVPEAPATPSVVLKEGDDAPAISLPDLDGKIVSLSDFTGSDTLVLFWNPGCGFCQRMLGDLRAFEENETAPRLLLVSTGDVETNRQAGLRATVLIDQGFTTGRAYGANGTPSAILVDADGKIAGPLLVGAPSILAASGHV